VEDALNDTSAAALLPWGDAKLTRTRRGPRLVSKAIPTPEFLAAYQADPESFRAFGVTCGEYDGKWIACWWKLPPGSRLKPLAQRNALNLGNQAFTLRDYQVEAVESGVNFLLEPADENGIIIIPTGGGKSLVIQNIAQNLPAPTLILQPSKEILEQNAAKFHAYGYHPALYSASVGRKEISDITLATIGSIVKKPQDFERFKYCIVDECHGVGAKNGDSMYMTFFRETEMKILGCTATPYRLSTDGYGGSILKFLTRTRPRLFHRVIYYVQNGQLFRDGYLCPLEYREVKAIRQERLVLNSTGADFTDASIQREFEAMKFKDVLEDTAGNLLAEGRKSILVFTRFVKEAAALAAKFPGAEIVHAETPKKERERVINGFKSGTIPFIANVGVLTLGFDYPALSTVVLAGPTMSLAQYYQKVGRCIRPHPSKNTALVIDMVGLVKRFGKVEDLTIHEGTNSKWWIGSGSRPLTNTYFGEPHGRPDWMPEKPANSTIKGNLLPTLY
jgi:DNA repair protein RadD